MLLGFHRRGICTFSFSAVQNVTPIPLWHSPIYERSNESGYFSIRLGYSGSMGVFLCDERPLVLIRVTV